MRLWLISPFAAAALVSSVLVGTAQAPAAEAFEPTLTYVQCPQDVEPAKTECAELTVPLDWQTPEDGRTTTIALRVIPSKRGGGGFTFNPGGPGGSGIQAGSGVYDELPRRVRDRFDFVMWDPRGIGDSGPTVSGCEPLPEPDLPDIGPVDWETIWSDHAVRTGEKLAACFAANPDSAPYLGTWQVVRDLEAMREALGYPRWNYWGMSYGTRIGYTYAKTFPNSLRTMIVDGSLWPQESVYRLASQQPTAWNTALQVYSSIVDRAQSRKLNQVLDTLDDTVVEREFGRITRWNVTLVIFAMMGDQSAYPDIKASINSLYRQVVKGKAPESNTENEEILDKTEEITQDAAADYVFSFINCADLHDRPTPAMAGRLAAQVARDLGTTMPMATGNVVKCMDLPADYSPGVPREFSSITLRTPPVVVLSNGDKNTPWIWGRTMANQYAGSRTITYNSSQHVTYQQTTSRCVNDPVTRYVLHRKLPLKNVFCAFAPSR